MAFIDDAKYSGRALHAPARLPRHVYSWAALGATLLLLGHHDRDGGAASSEPAPFTKEKAPRSFLRGALLMLSDQFR